jgi:ABC-type dipeptide/oligopeptide/nickel transport system ATPase subunit
VAPLLEVRNLAISFDTEEGVVAAVTGVSFSVDPGKTLGLVGESGCGKSVTCHSILRLIPQNGHIHSGEILYGGKDLLKIPNAELDKIRGHDIAMIFQDPSSSLNPVHTIGRQLIESLVLHRGMNKTSARAEALRLLDTVGIPEANRRLGEYPHQLSGGMNQRAMIAIALASLPFLLIALAVLAFFGNSFTLFIIIMGINGWENYARLTRGMVLSANTHGYAVAVRSLGAKPSSVYFRHILPNIISILIVQFTLNFPSTILLETSLSFLGLGIQPPLTSLGQMLGAGRAHLLYSWWIAVLPGALIFFTTLSISIIGDWLRDRLDPTLKNR